MFGATVRELLFACAGVAGGAFMPAVGRKIKAAFTSETKKLVLELKAKVEQLEKDATAEVKKV